MGQLSFVLYSPRDEVVARIRQSLDETGHAEVLATARDLRRLDDLLRSKRPEALFLDVSEDPDAVLDRIEALPAPRPLLVVSGPQEDSQLILRAMRLGAAEYLPSDPTDAELAAAVQRALFVQRPEAPARVRAPVVAVMGAKGGVGATHVACQLAAALQQHGSRVVVVDLNLPLGDVALHLDLEPAYTLANVAKVPVRLDASYLRTLLESHASGVQVLAAPSRIEEAELVTASHVERTIELLRLEVDWVILDVSRTWSEACLRALDLADQIVLVTLRDVPSLKHTREHLDLLDRLGHPPGKIRVVANRCGRSDAVTTRDFAVFLDRQADATLPNDYRTSSAALNEGRPVAEIAPRSALAREFSGLARELFDWCEVPAPEARATGIAARLRQWMRGGSA